MQKPMCSSKILLAAAGALLLTFLPTSGSTQWGTSSKAPQVNQQPQFPDVNSKDADPAAIDLQRRQEKARNDDRQKRLVADSERLLQLATALHDDVSKTNKNMLSIEVIRRAEEIEKLAHNVKEREKG